MAGESPFFFFLEIRDYQSLKFECCITVPTLQHCSWNFWSFKQRRKTCKKKDQILFKMETQITNVLPLSGCCCHSPHGRRLSYDCNYQHNQAIRVWHQGLPVIVPKVICFKKKRKSCRWMNTGNWIGQVIEFSSIDSNPAHGAQLRHQ